MLKDEVDLKRRRFLIAATSVVGAIGAAFAAVPFVSSWWPSAKARAAAAPVECDISKLKPGQQVTTEWRGKPVWVVRRTKEVVDGLNKLNNELRDPLSKVDQQPSFAQNIYRSLKPEYLVLVGVCTHLGCAPKYKP